MTTLSDEQRNAVQRRVVRTLGAAQVLGGIGVAAGTAVGALLMADLGSDAVSGMAASSSVIGAALIAIPVSRTMSVSGRRPGLLLAYAIGITGALLVISGAVLDSFLVALVGLLLAGGGTTATLQSRYAATDLATAERRGRSLSTVVWATTVGSILGPNFASPMGRLAEAIGIPKLAGPFLLTVTVYVLAAGVVAAFLRPDPLLVARGTQNLSRAENRAHARTRGTMKDALRLIWSSPTAQLGLASVALGHAVMVAVMSMTPVHLEHGGASLEIVGLVISLHITGMYIASPLVGLAVDRFGRGAVILLGSAILLLSFVIAGTASGHDSTQLAVGLTLLGLGWSCTLIAGSTLLTESVPVASRPTVQGTSDLVMGIAGASAGLLAGVIVGFGSYALLTVAAAALIIPLVVVTLSRRPHLAAVSAR